MYFSFIIKFLYNKYLLIYTKVMRTLHGIQTKRASVTTSSTLSNFTK